jgi:hypothetical protein
MSKDIKSDKITQSKLLENAVLPIPILMSIRDCDINVTIIILDNYQKYIEVLVSILVAHRDIHNPDHPKE